MDLEAGIIMIMMTMMDTSMNIWLITIKMGMILLTLDVFNIMTIEMMTFDLLLTVLT